MGAGLNPVIVLATLAMQITLGTLWYGPLFGGVFSRIVYGRRQPPESPLWPMLTTALSTGFLMVFANYIAVQFSITTWQQGLKLAAALWVVDACLNIRHYMFEHRPFNLFLIHSGYHLMTLGLTCCLLASFAMRDAPLRDTVAQRVATAALQSEL